MKLNDDRKEFWNERAQEQSLPSFSKDLVTIYIGLCILIKIKNILGLEAMLDYMKMYQQSIEKSNPELKTSVKEVLSLMNIEKMYHDAVDC